LPEVETTVAGLRSVLEGRVLTMMLAPKKS